jgi:hypothetical protein
MNINKRSGREQKIMRERIRRIAWNIKHNLDMMTKLEEAVIEEVNGKHGQKDLFASLESFLIIISYFEQVKTIAAQNAVDALYLKDMITRAEGHPGSQSDLR